MAVEQFVLSDEAVLAGLRAGDERIFRDYYERQCPAMRRVARSYLTSDALIDEVVQETWVAVIKGIDRFQGRSALSTWVFSILINQAKTHAVREGRMLPFSSITRDDADDGEPAVPADRFRGDEDEWPGYWATPPRPWQKPEQRLLALDARSHLAQALAELPERQRLIVALRDVEGLPAEEVCELLQLSQENQRVLLHRGRSRLRAALESYLDGDAGAAV
jgi:RNA polymerase sigma-70 factor (ECF subfamily)